VWPEIRTGLADGLDQHRPGEERNGEPVVGAERGRDHVAPEPGGEAAQRLALEPFDPNAERALLLRRRAQLDGVIVGLGHLEPAGGHEPHVAELVLEARPVAQGGLRERHEREALVLDPERAGVDP
jgi:hypothetical protein